MTASSRRRRTYGYSPEVAAFKAELDRIFWWVVVFNLWTVMVLAALALAIIAIAR